MTHICQKPVASLATDFLRLKKMIELCFQNNKACIYSATAWEKVRKEYRIVGSFLGSSAHTPALPVALLPEEVSLLVNKKLAKIVCYPKLQDVPTQTQSEGYSKLQSDLLLAQQAIYREDRKRDLEQIVDKIIEGKIKKSNGVYTGTREEILEEELNKSCDVTDKTMVWPILSEPLQTVQGEPVDVPLSQFLEQTTPTKCAVFADLWEKGYYITPGIKFGGDFLVYLGEPIAFHAIYIVRCIEDPDKQNHTSEIIAFGRLGTSVKKRAVLAALEADGSVSYISLNWLDA